MLYLHMRTKYGTVHDGTCLSFYSEGTRRIRSSRLSVSFNDTSLIQKKDWGGGRAESEELAFLP